MKIHKSIFLCGVLFQLFLLLFPMHMLEAQYNITLATDPPAEHIIPDSRTAKFTLHVTDESGKPVPSADAKIVLKSPERGRFFSTDFPWVENSTLLELQSELVNGNFTFHYLMPIRGTYRLDVEVKKHGSAALFKKNFQLKVYENPNEMKRLYTLALILFGIGFTAGIYFQKSKGALTAAMLALLLLPSSLQAHTHKHIEGKGKEIHTIQNAATILSVTLAPGHGTVGKTTQLEISLADLKKNIIRHPVYFEVQTVNNEDKVDVFHAVFFAHEGKTTQALQFSDGADHTLNVRAFLENPAGRTLKPAASFSKEIEVETFQPPKKIVAKTLSYFMLVLAMGVLAGEFFGQIAGGASAQKTA